MTARWHVAQTKPLAERVAWANLNNQGFGAFLPMYREPRRNRAEPLSRAAPMFPCYLFVEFDADVARWRSINGTRGVLRLLCDGDAPTPVPEGIVEELQSKAGKDGAIELPNIERFAPDQKVRITQGNFVDCVAQYVASDRDRVMLLIDMLGSKVRISVPDSQVAPAS